MTVNGNDRDEWLDYGITRTFVRRQSVGLGLGRATPNQVLSDIQHFVTDVLPRVEKEQK